MFEQNIFNVSLVKHVLWSLTLLVGCSTPNTFFHMWPFIVQNVALIEIFLLFKVCKNMENTFVLFKSSLLLFPVFLPIDHLMVLCQNKFCEHGILYEYDNSA